MGGLGSAVAGFLSEHYPVPVLRHGVNDTFGRSGKAEEVLTAYGLTAEGIAHVMSALPDHDGLLLPTIFYVSCRIYLQCTFKETGFGKHTCNYSIKWRVKRHTINLHQAL